MSTRNLALLLAAAVALGGCAAAGSGGTGASPYAGRHDHNRDAKQGVAGSPATAPQAPIRRGSLRPAS
jgi:hypothetical protein